MSPSGVQKQSPGRESAGRSKKLKPFCVSKHEILLGNLQSYAYTASSKIVARELWFLMM